MVGKPPAQAEEVQYHSDTSLGMVLDPKYVVVPDRIRYCQLVQNEFYPATLYRNYRRVLDLRKACYIFVKGSNQNPRRYYALVWKALRAQQALLVSGIRFRAWRVRLRTEVGD